MEKMFTSERFYLFRCAICNCPQIIENSFLGKGDESMRGVIYARYSSDNQREESIEGQIRENTAYAEKNGITIVGHYIDRAFSAKTDDRPEFQRMIADSSKKMFDVIIVWKLDRFSRNRYDSARHKATLRKYGVKVVSATEAIADGPSGILMESVLEGMAEYYSAELSEKITRGMTENALKCKYNGSHVPFGFVIDENRNYQINETLAPIVVEIYERYASGEAIKPIIDDLNARGLKTSKGAKFGNNSIHSILTNRMYMGEYHFGEIIIPNGIPAMVSEELFNRVAERKKKNQHASAHNKGKERYILSTKLFCGKCMTMMVGESGQKKNGNIYRYYKCASAKRKKGCDKKAVRKEWIEDEVIKGLTIILNDDATLSAMADKLLELFEEDNVVLPALEVQLKEVQKSIANLIKAVEQGLVTRSTKSRLEELEAEEETLKESIFIEQNKVPRLSKEQILCVLERFRSLDLSIERNRERLVDALVKCIVLYDDKFIITVTFRDEPIVVMTSEEAADVARLGSDINSLAPPNKTDADRASVPLFLWRDSNGSVVNDLPMADQSRP